jgi:hypothetical protein
MNEAQTIISRAREEHGDADGFDYMVAVQGIGRYGALYNEAYTLANEDQPPVTAGAGAKALEARRDRAAELWTRVLPELQAYETECQAARFTGWSDASGGPVRRVQDIGAVALAALLTRVIQGRAPLDSLNLTADIEEGTPTVLRAMTNDGHAFDIHVQAVQTDTSVPVSEDTAAG